MQKTKAPIRRSRQLAPLSREHHEGLLFVWKIRQGIAFNVPAGRIAQYCDWYWENVMRAHFQKEEEILSPLLPREDVLINTMLEDHQAISQKIQDVIADPSYYSLQRLAQIIYYHIRFEERHLFPHVERTASAKLQMAADALSEGPRPVEAWTDEFWFKKPKVTLFETSLH
jgi:hypothetical protein